MPRTVITAKLFVLLPRKTMDDRKVIINLNGYRNWHYLVSNQIKKQYKEDIAPQLEGLVFPTPISIEFIYYKGSRRRSDRSNVLSIHEKFFCDALTELGCIEDDNDDYIKETKYKSGGIDKDNPRVEIVIST